MFGKVLMRGLLAAALAVSAVTAQAVTIDLVTVGNPGNAPDPRLMNDGTAGYGAVPYSYNMGKFEVTAGQYAEFLNAVAKTDTYGLYNTEMDTALNRYGCNIQRTGSLGTYSYTVASDWANRPVNFVSWGDAARFTNWLSNGQTTGAQGLATTEDGAYYLNGAMSDAELITVTRKASATWMIPSEDEWYKAAYHDKTAGLAASYFDYPTGTNSVPGNMLPDPGNNANFDQAFGGTYWRTPVGAFTNSPSPYGTFDQGGNVAEWNETNTNNVAYGARGLRGGAFYYPSLFLAASHREYGYPSREDSVFGFRVASVPEPGSIALLVAGAMCALGYAWRRRKGG